MKNLCNLATCANLLLQNHMQVVEVTVSSVDIPSRFCSIRISLCHGYQVNCVLFAMFSTQPYSYNTHQSNT